MLCKSEGCSYKIHPNPKNNNGSHCCRLCMVHPNKHGSHCKKLLDEILNIVKSRKHRYTPPIIESLPIDKRMQVVIARYSEDVEWSKAIANKIIYNKGPAMKASDFIISLPNVGREGHTFAHHIVENYDKLFDYTCFLQGHPFDHCPNILTLIATLPTEPYTILSKGISSFNLDKCPRHRGLPLRNCYKILFDSDSNADYEFGHGAQMIVSRVAIHRHPKEFYQKIVNMLGHAVNPAEGFVIERFWKLIFTE